MNGSVHLSVPPSVCPSHRFHYVLIIASSRNFKGWLPMTEVMSMVKMKTRGQRSRSQRSKPNFAFSGPWLQFEFTDRFEIMHKASRSIEKVPYYFFRSSTKFQGHNGQKIDYLNQILSKITRLLADVKSLRFDLFLLYFHIIMHSFLYFLRHDPIFPAHSLTGGLEFSNENIQQHCGKAGHPVLGCFQLCISTLISLFM